MKYHVGDVVRITDRWNDKCQQNQSGLMDKWLGKEMTIAKVGNVGYTMKEDGGRWVWNDFCIAELVNSPAETETVVITCNGKETAAFYLKGSRIVKQASVRRRPDDPHDLSAAVTLAIDRLGLLSADASPVDEQKKEAPQLYNGRVVCVDSRFSPTAYTTGKIYTFKDGTFITDLGAPVCAGRRFESFDQFAQASWAKWLEITGEQDASSTQGS